MFSPTNNSSSPLIQGSTTNYHSTNTSVPSAEVNDSDDEEIEVIIANAESTSNPSRAQEQALPQQATPIEQIERLIRTLAAVNQYASSVRQEASSYKGSLHKLANNIKWHGYNARGGSITFNISAVIALSKMKIEGHLDEHLNYFGWLMAFLVVSYLSLNEVASNCSKLSQRLKEETDTLPTTTAAGVRNQRSISEALRTNATTCEFLSSLYKYMDAFVNTGITVMVLTMTFKGFFDKHPLYFAILLFDDIGSSSMMREAAEKFSGYAKSMNDLAHKIESTEQFNSILALS